MIQSCTVLYFFYSSLFFTPYYFVFVYRTQVHRVGALLGAVEGASEGKRVGALDGAVLGAVVGEEVVGALVGEAVMPPGVV